MNKQKFAEYLRSPEKLDRESFTDLVRLTEQYPYFQSARTLLAKAAKIKNSKKAGAYVSTAAVYATDRALLKRYINDELIFLSPLTVHESHEAEREIEITQAIKTNKIATTLRVNKEETEAPKPKAKKPIQSSGQIPEGYLQPEDLLNEQPTQLDNMIDELYKDMEQLKINRAKLKEIEDRLIEEEAVDTALRKVSEKITEQSEDLEEREATAPAIDTEEDLSADLEDQIDLSSSEESEKTNEELDSDDFQPSFKISRSNVRIETFDETDEDEITESEHIHSAEVSFKEPEADKAPEIEKEKPIKPSESRAARISRITSEVEISKSLTGESPSVEDSTSEREMKITPSESASTEIEEESEDEGERKKSEQSQIIENFIKSNPSITPARSVANASISDLANYSTELHPDIASEYLAEIYLEQGRKDRAIQIYTNLIVRFPEKSIYFADIIKKLNDQI